jgi:hypothetical protein
MRTIQVFFCSTKFHFSLEYFLSLVCGAWMGDCDFFRVNQLTPPRSYKTPVLDSNPSKNRTVSGPSIPKIPTQKINESDKETNEKRIKEKRVKVCGWIKSKSNKNDNKK